MKKNKILKIIAFKLETRIHVIILSKPNLQLINFIFIKIILFYFLYVFLNQYRSI